MKAKAAITWRTPEEGGLKAGPPTARYAPQVRFTDINEPWPHETIWSLVVEKLENTASEYQWLAVVGYLYPNAPSENLRIDRPFELYEGKKCVASGIILEPLP